MDISICRLSCGIIILRNLSLGLFAKLSSISTGLWIHLLMCYYTSPFCPGFGYVGQKKPLPFNRFVRSFLQMCLRKTSNNRSLNYSCLNSGSQLLHRMHVRFQGFRFGRFLGMNGRSDEVASSPIIERRQ